MDIFQKTVQVKFNATNILKCSNALCDFGQDKNDKVYSEINNDCNESSCNFISSVNKVLLQTDIATVKNDRFQYQARISFDNGSQSSYVTPKLYEKLNLKFIASRQITIKVFVNHVLQEKLAFVRVCLKTTYNENIAINCLVKDTATPLFIKVFVRIFVTI